MRKNNRISIFFFIRLLIRLYPSCDKSFSPFFLLHFLRGFHNCHQAIATKSQQKEDSSTEESGGDLRKKDKGKEVKRSERNFLSGTCGKRFRNFFERVSQKIVFSGLCWHFLKGTKNNKKSNLPTTIKSTDQKKNGFSAKFLCCWILLFYLHLSIEQTPTPLPSPRSFFFLSLLFSSLACC